MHAARPCAGGERETGAERWLASDKAPPLIRPYEAGNRFVEIWAVDLESPTTGPTVIDLLAHVPDSVGSRCGTWWRMSGVEDELIFQGPGRCFARKAASSRTDEPDRSAVNEIPTADQDEAGERRRGVIRQVVQCPAASRLRNGFDLRNQCRSTSPRIRWVTSTNYLGGPGLPGVEMVIRAAGGSEQASEGIMATVTAYVSALRRALL